jgi:pyruvate formate lyase activating enzyme
LHEARFYETREPGVLCRLCPQFCRLQAQETGLCGVRREWEGRLYTLNYGRCAAMAMDPVEKKPLYHFYPGRPILSVGTVGCNLSCGFCQNWHLARNDPGVEPRQFSPDQLADMLLQHRDSHPIGIAYTYSEPGMWFEFVLDTAARVRQKGYRNVMVTNGYLNGEPLRELLPLTDAMNIDVKAFDDAFYRSHCGGRLKPVQRYVEMAAAACHVELTYLVVPTLNDHAGDIRRFADWVASIDPAIPVHFSRYYPQHKFTLPPTSPQVMEDIRRLAQEKLHHVYLGNLPGHDGAHTYCPACGARVIERDGYRVRNLLQGYSCPACGRKQALTV